MNKKKDIKVLFMTGFNTVVNQAQTLVLTPFDKDEVRAARGRGGREPGWVRRRPA